MKNFNIIILVIFTVFNFTLAGTGIASSQLKESAVKANYKPAQDPIEKVKIYPNPVSDDYLYVKLNLWESNNANPPSFNFKVHDILGNSMEVETEELGNATYSIQVNDYPKGYYMLTVSCQTCNKTSDGNVQEGFKKAFKFLKQ